MNINHLVVRLSRHAAENLIKPQNSHRSTFAGELILIPNWYYSLHLSHQEFRIHYCRLIPSITTPLLTYELSHRILSHPVP